MQLRRFEIKGLFRTFDHEVAFPLPTAEGTHPALVILHGRNGIGKTTILRMLDGMMRLDFNMFRAVPFTSCTLDFTPAVSLTVTRGGKEALEYLNVTFGAAEARLHPLRPGPLLPKDSDIVQAFRTAFFDATKDIAFELIETERFRPKRPHPDMPEDFRMLKDPEAIQLLLHGAPTNPKAKPAREPGTVASRVHRFIRDAKANYRTFFATTEPELFPRIIERLTSAGETTYTIIDLRARLADIRSQDHQTGRFGLEADYWDFDQLMAHLDALALKTGAARDQALTVLGTYVEQLESRAKERALVAERLLTFEKLMSEFLVDKRVAIDSREGLRIETASGLALEEHQLSSGEYHLLFLMVAALVTRRRGTVIAIDEPEMSMHIAWQRKLVPALVKCASGAEPLFIFATHSPDLAATFPSAMVELQ